MTKKRPSILSIVLFAIALLLLVYTVWSVVIAHSTVAEAIAAGQLVIKGNLYNIITFYLTSCAQYLLFAVLFIAIGFNSFKTVEVSEIEPEADADTDAYTYDYDEFITPEDVEFDAIAADDAADEPVAPADDEKAESSEKA
jgi:hypothetical protein